MSTQNMMREVRAHLAWWKKRGAGLIFDSLHRVDTGGGIAAEDLEVASANLEKGIAYDPCPWSTLRRSLQLASLRADGFTFLDIGCGKAKVLLSAMALPFTRIIGVEYSAHLARIAERNVASARFVTRRCSSVEIICVDAVQYQVPEEPSIFFFANPFNYEIMEVVLDNIVSSYLRAARPIFLLFFGASSLMPQISVFLPEKSGGRARRLASSTLSARSINIFELFDGRSEEHR